MRLGTLPRNTLQIHTGLEPVYDEFGEEPLTEVVKHREKVAAQQKSVGRHKLFGVLISLDDLAATSVMRNTRGTIARLAIRGRHSCASLSLSSQSYKAMHPLIRAQLKLLLLWRNSSKRNCNRFKMN